MPFRAEHYQKLIDWSPTEEALTQFAGPTFTFPLTAQQIDNHLANQTIKAYAVADNRTSVIVGHGELFNTHTACPKIALVLIGDDHYRGLGLGKEIIKLLLNESFLGLKAQQVELNVYDWNMAARRCYESVGFEYNTAKNFFTHVKGNQWKALNMIINKDQHLHKILSN